MSMLWTAPIALAGLALIALPIAVHLFVRQQVRTLPYPSLRFLRETQLAAFRRRRIEDAVLLACRCAILALAALALAGPVVLTQTRSDAQARRISRAVVAVSDLPPEVTSRLTTGALVSTIVQRSTVADGLADAVRWVDRQPRSAREIVIAGELHRGVVESSDVATVPTDIGIRFEQLGSDRAADQTVAVLTRTNGIPARVVRSMHLTPETTRVIDGAVTPVPAPVVSIVAPAKEQLLADAALNAALTAGIPWRDFDRRITVVWAGADEATIPRDGSIVRMDVPRPASSAADAVHAALLTAAGPKWAEPIALTRDQLGAWSRSPGPPSDNAPVVDEGDRRWVWAFVLVLLGVEWRLRQRTAAHREQRIEPAEAQVA